MNFDLMTQELRRDEGELLKMYSDSEGIPTIGVGHNLRDKPISARASRVILEDDLNDTIAALDRSFPWWRKLSELRQRVMVNMAFNLGVGGLGEFTKMLHALNAGDYKTAAAEMIESKWSKQVGARADRLAKMMEDSQ